MVYLTLVQTESRFDVYLSNRHTSVQLLYTNIPNIWYTHHEYLIGTCLKGWENKATRVVIFCELFLSIKQLNFYFMISSYLNIQKWFLDEYTANKFKNVYSNLHYDRL